MAAGVRTSYLALKSQSSLQAMGDARCACCLRQCACAEDSVEVALAFFKACGAYLQDVNNQGYQR